MIQVVHPAPGNATGTLVNGVLHHCSLPIVTYSGDASPSDSEDIIDEDGSFSSNENSDKGLTSADYAASIRPGIVHRLDKGTSGLLVIAKVFFRSLV